MPATATITAYHTMIANTRAKASEQNTNFGVWRGHHVPVDPTLAAAVNNAYDMGSTEYAWRAGYFGTGGIFSNGNRVDRAGFTTVSSTVSASAGILTYLADPSTGAGVILPYGVGATGSVTTVKKIGVSGNPVWVQSPTTTALIEGMTSTTVPNGYGYASYLYDGSNYHEVDSGGLENVTTSSTFFSGTIGGAGASSGILDLSIPVSANARGNRSFEGLLTSGQTSGSATLVITRLTTTVTQIGVSFQFMRDSSVVAQRIHDFIAVTTVATQFPPEWFSFRDDNVPAGPHTWSVKASSNSGNANQCRFTGNVYLRVREVE